MKRTLKPLNPCLVSGVVEAIPVTNIDKVDMLFMVDNSDSMADKQALLRSQFPRLITLMTTGDIDGDGKPEFPPPKDLHLGVITSDLGLPGAHVDNCVGLGQDGILQHQPSAQIKGCKPSYPTFLSFQSGLDQPTQTAQDFACIAQVGTGGCGFEHQLEATLKALWPSVDPMAAQNGGKNRITFLADPDTGMGALGHGDTDNAGFLRNDPTQGLSLIAVILLSDEDDCSSADTRPFKLPQDLDPNDPVLREGMNVRCHFNQDALYPVERYVNGLKALRPGNENLVIFAGIVGVPQDLTNADVLAKTDFAKPADRNRFYGDILADSRMVEQVNDQGTADPSDDKLAHSCVLDTQQAAVKGGQFGAADPPIRIVKVAQGFGENGIVQSICQSDYGPALDQIVKVIGNRLHGLCLPRSLVRNGSGTVGCNVVWELPASGLGPLGTPTSCHDPNFPFLLDPEPGSAMATDHGGAICRVAQLAVKTDASGKKTPVDTLTAGTSYGEGWYYDDFSDDTRQICPRENLQRIAFTANAKPPTGVTVKLECLNETQSLANDRTDLAPSGDQPSIGSACDNVVRNGQTQTGDAACVIHLSAPSRQWPDGVDRSLFCHPQQNVCVRGCSTDADCPAAWVCDRRAETLASTSRPEQTNGSAICVNPTCGDSHAP